MPYAGNTSIILHSWAYKLNKWFKENKLIFNFNKTNTLNATINKICYSNKTTKVVVTTRFLGLEIDNSHWKRNIAQIIPTLCAACFIMRALTAHMTTDISILVYFEDFHSIMSYRFICCGNSTDATTVLTTKKKIINIHDWYKDSMGNYLTNLLYVPLWANIYITLSFTVKKTNKF